MSYRLEHDLKHYKYFNIIRQGKFTIEITPTDLEKIKEPFTSYDLLIRKYGTDPLGDYDNKYTEENTFPIKVYTLYKTTEIITLVKDWGETIKEKSACTSIQIPGARTLLNELEPYLLNEFIPYPYKIIGDRIYNKIKIKELEQNKRIKEREASKRKAEASKRKAEALKAMPYERPEEITYSDLNQIINGAKNAISNHYGFSIINIGYCNAEQPIHFFKRATSWKKVEKEIKLVTPKKQHKKDLFYMKQLWDNPSLL